MGFLSLLTGLVMAVTPPDSDYTAFENERLEETRKVYSFTMPEVKPLEAGTSVGSRPIHASTPGDVGPAQLDEPPKVRLLINRHISINGDLEELEGFRVQIYAGGSMEAATAARSEAQKRFPEWEVHQLWQAPHFRVRVGDYVSRSDAMRDLNRIKTKFPGAYIVPDKVKPPKKAKHTLPPPGDVPLPEDDEIPGHN
jgi:SPOR domain